MNSTNTPSLFYRLRSNRALLTTALVLVGFALIVGLLTLMGSLANEQTAINALETQGFSEVEITERDPFFAGVKGCGEEDVVIFTAQAVNPAGDEVTVEVCQGWPFKGATIRG